MKRINSTSLFDRIDNLDGRGRYVYAAPYVLPESIRMQWLGLDNVDQLEAIESSITLTSDIAITCTGNDCPYAATCPLIRSGKVDRWVSKDCPVEIVEGYKHLSGYIHDLNIMPDHYTDIEMVNDLIRLQIQMKRCDKLLKSHVPTETSVAGQDTKTSLVHNAKKMSSLMEAQKSLRRDISEIYKSLLASRSAKMEVSKLEKKKSDLSTALSNLLQQAESGVDGRMSRLEVRQEGDNGNEE